MLTMIERPDAAHAYGIDPFYQVLSGEVAFKDNFRPSIPIPIPFINFRSLVLLIPSERLYISCCAMRMELIS